MNRRICKADDLHICSLATPEGNRLFLEAGKVLEYPKKWVLFRQRALSEYIYFLMDGTAQIYTLGDDGRKRILFIMGSHQLLNDSVTLSISSIFCETLTPCTLYAIPRDRFLTIMKQDFLFAMEVFRIQEHKMWRLEHQMKNTVGRIGMERKLAAKLWKLARDFGEDTERGIRIHLDLSVTFLADLVGVPRETASRGCKKLESMHLIEMEKKTIFIKDPQKITHFYKTGEI